MDLGLLEWVADVSRSCVPHGPRGVLAVMILRRAETVRTRRGLRFLQSSRRGLRLCLFGLAPSREALLLRSIVGARFQFVVLTLVALKGNALS